MAPINSEAAAEVDGALKNLPTDAFVEILLRLPPSSRWRFRLVSWHWRAVIDEGTPRGQPKALLFCVNTTMVSASSAYVVDDLSSDGRSREIWRQYRRHDRMIGTCNGLLCLCGGTNPIALANPVTGETLDVPPCPGYRIWQESWKAFSFGFHLPTGLYKIVRLPRADGFSELQVLTLGDASWRDVPVPGGSSSYRLDAGLVSVDGSTFWVTKGAERVVSFDLGDESFANVALPVDVGGGRYRCHQLTEVWVLGEGRDRHKWSRRYSVQVQGVAQLLARPHFAHGEYVLTTERGTKVFGHRLRDGGRPLVSGEVRSVRIRDPGTPVAGIATNSFIRGTFAYVETTEPLSCYRLDS
ncbi:hypothetical protein EJB05_48524, partial [Eragrostis curvula]